MAQPEDVISDITKYCGKLTADFAHDYELLHVLMDNMPDSIYFKDKESRFIKVNRAKAEHSKTDPEDMIGKTDFDFLPEEQAKRAFLDENKVMESGKPIKDKAEKLTHKDGTEVWVSATKIPWYNKEGDIIGIIGISRDITKRKKDEELLKESRKRFSTICASAKDSIIILNSQGEITYWNCAAEETFGYKSNEVMNKDLHSFLVPESYHEDFRKGFSRFKINGEGPIIGKTYEMKAIKKDGTEFPVELSVSAVKIKGSWNAIGIIRDITERKQTEKKIRRDFHIQSIISSILRVSLEPISFKIQLELILDLILSIPFLSLESKGCIYLVEDNPDVLVIKAQRRLHESLMSTCENVTFGKCCCGLAASKREIVFADCIDKRHEVSYQGMIPHGHYCVPILSGEKVLGVINLYVKEGHRREPIEEEFLHTVANTLAGIVERKTTEDDLRKYREHLEELVRERTKEIMEVNNNLKNEIKDRKFAQDALNKQRERFISVLIHDLKGPLVPVLGYIKRLIDGKAKSEEDALRILNIIQGSSHRLFKIIEGNSKDLKNKSALHSFNPEEIVFNDVLSSVITNSIPEMESRGINIYINNVKKENMDALEKIIIKADLYQLRTLVENLLGNAIKYANSTVKIELHRSDYDVQFIISDDGPGIQEDYHEKIFEEYFQAPNSKFGTGIGLYSVKRVVENHRGKILINSSSELGTRFNISFPH